MNINANFGGLWGDNCAIFCLANYLHKPISANFGGLWGDNCAIFCLVKNNCVICFWAGDDFISNNTL